MTQKNGPNDPTLENVPEKLRSAREIAPNIPNVILDFAEYMAAIAEKPVYNYPFIAETLWGLAYDAKKSIETQSDVDIPVPEKLKGKMPEIFANIESFYVLVDKISSKEFSKKFKTLYLFGNRQVV